MEPLVAILFKIELASTNKKSLSWWNWWLAHSNLVVKEQFGKVPIYRKNLFNERAVSQVVVPTTQLKLCYMRTIKAMGYRGQLTCSAGWKAWRGGWGPCWRWSRGSGQAGLPERTEKSRVRIEP